MLEDEYDYYRRQSKADLVQAFARLSEQQLQSGELNAEALRETYRVLAPLLDERQREMLRQLLDALS